MPAYLDYFLNAVESDIPDVTLRDMSGEGETLRKDWGFDIANYTPKGGGTLFLNANILNDIVNAKQVKAQSKKEAKAAESKAAALRKIGLTKSKHAQHGKTSSENDKQALKSQIKAVDKEARDAWNRVESARDSLAGFDVLMPITIAHELVHFFVGYISGGPVPAQLIPGPVVDGSGIWGDLDNDEGESGRRWEEEVFGGSFDFFEDANDLMGTKQAGTAYIIDGHWRCTALSKREVRDKFDLAKPRLLTSSKTTPLQTLEANHRRMSVVRYYAQTPNAASPNSAAGPSQGRCLPHVNGSGYSNTGSSMSVEVSQTDEVEPWDFADFRNSLPGTQEG